MRVMCIKQGEWWDIRLGKNTIGPKYGDECRVIDVIESKEKIRYNLKEWPTERNPHGNGRMLFLSDHFIPLSDEPEETESISEPTSEPCLS